MTLNFLSTLEDPAHPSLGPTLWGLQILVMCPSNKGKLRIMYFIFNFLTILMVASEYIELYCIRNNLASALYNLSLTFIAHVGVVKISTFLVWHKKWMSVINNVSSLEKLQLEQQDKVTKQHIYKYSKYSRNITFYYLALVVASDIVFFLLPLIYLLYSLCIRNTTNNEETPYPKIISSWVPFDETKGFGYWSAILIKIILSSYISIAFSIYDANVFGLMTFFFGQLRILKSNCERIFGNEEETISYTDANARIQMCHHHHVLLVKYFNDFNSLLSPIMFFYIIICSLTICASAVQLNAGGVAIMENLRNIEYLIAQIFQLCLFCWHGHKVLDMSHKVDEGIYASRWWSQDRRLKRSFMLLGGQLNKAMQFNAGPFVNLNLVTCITILKGAYSYYKLLNEFG